MGPCYPYNYSELLLYHVLVCYLKEHPLRLFLKGKVLTQDLIFNGRILLNDSDMN